MIGISIPYLIGYAAHGDDWQFTGFLIGVEDGNSYIAKMLSGASGKWLFRSPYSAEPQAGVFSFLPYLLIGKLTSGIAQHEQLVVLFHAYRILAGVLVALAIDDFISLFIENSTRRTWALVVILLGGGLGWALAAAEMKNLLGSIPLDFLSPESFGFLGLFGLPHLTLARALLFWGATYYLKEDNGVKAGMFWSAMGIFQPMYILIIWVVIGFHALAEILWSKFENLPENKAWSFHSSYSKKALLAGLISCPLAFYTAGAFYLDPYFKAWASQNILPSPHWIHYLVAYGMVLPFAISGIIKLIRVNPTSGLLLTCWIAASPFLIYAPMPTQRRLAEGIWVILIIGFFGFFKEKEPMPVFGKIVLGLMLPTTVFLLIGATLRSTQPSSPVFIPGERVDAYLYLKENAPIDSIVLSSFEVGNSLPAWAPVRVVQGHGPESVHLAETQAEIEDYFLNNQGRNNCGEYFHEKGIDYLFWGPDEEKQWNWNPDLKYCLRQVYNSDGYKIYLVTE